MGHAESCSWRVDRLIRIVFKGGCIRHKSYLQGTMGEPRGIVFNGRWRSYQELYSMEGG